MTRPLIASLLALPLLACDPSFLVVVARPVTQPVARSCAAEALKADSTFKVARTAGDSTLATRDSATLGTFRWQLSEQNYREHGALSHRFGTGVDTVVATIGRLGIASPADVQRAEQELSARVNLIVERCTRPVGPSQCSFLVSGREPVPCATAR